MWQGSSLKHPPKLIIIGEPVDAADLTGAERILAKRTTFHNIALSHKKAVKL
jgi:hypothetical protein